ncbi:MAG: hypothetical protein ABSB54_17730, partial [Acidimicrobiales bacterium]
LVTRAPTAVAALLGGADLLCSGVVEVAVTGERPDLVSHVARRWLPRTVLAWSAGEASRSDPGLPLLEGRAEGFAYVCRAGACRLPAADAGQLDDELAAALAH